LNKLLEEIQQYKLKLDEKEQTIKELSSDRDEKQREIDRLKFFIERIEYDRKPLENELEE
jgi:chromosome segregation ATPase